MSTALLPSVLPPAAFLSSARDKATYSATDLTRRLQRVVHVAERAVCVLGHDGYQGSSAAERVSADKVVAETSMLLLACQPLLATNSELRSGVNRLIDLLAPLARSDRVRAGICLQPAMALDFAFAHICLSRLGRPDPSVDRLLEAALAPGAGYRERLPHRALEQQWILSVWDPGHPARSASRTARAIDASMLAESIDGLAASRDDLYALTHALMYVGALARPLSVPIPSAARHGGADGLGRIRLPRPAAAIAADAEAGLAHCLARQDYDLAAELLLTWPLLGRPFTASAQFALTVLTRIEDEVGFLPSAITRADRYHELVGDEQAKYALATTYHTAYTMGLLCCASLNGVRPTFAADSPSPTASPNRRRRAWSVTAGGAFDELERRARTGARDTPFWLNVYDELSSAERRLLAPLLVSMTLRSATEARDLRGAQALVGIAGDLGLAELPTVRQAGLLLDRCAFLAG